MIHTHTYEEVLLEVAGVTAQKRGTLILRDLNLEIKNIVRPGLTQGQVVGLLGPSGVGKTTLFRILAGLDRPTSGTVMVRSMGFLGTDMLPVHPGEVGVVAQHYPLLRHRTVLNNLLVAGRQAGCALAKAKSQACELLVQLGMQDHWDKYPAQLSGGQRQRIAIAQQFMCGSSLILMDEPFSGLDIVAKRQAISLISQLAAADEFRTFVVVTHDIESAIACADTLWLMGRERDPEGNVIPGARIQLELNLIERGLAWEEEPHRKPEFFALLREIQEIFPRL